MSSSIPPFSPGAPPPFGGKGFPPGPPPLSGQQQQQLLSALQKIAQNGQASAGSSSQQSQWASLASQVSQLQSSSGMPAPQQMQQLFQTMKSLGVSPADIQSAGGPTPPKGFPTNDSFGHFGDMSAARGRFHQAHQHILQGVSQLTGIDASTLSADLQGGQSLEGIAASKGVSSEKLLSTIKSALQSVHSDMPEDAVNAIAEHILTRQGLDAPPGLPPPGQSPST